MILHDRIKAGLYPGVMSGAMFSLIIGYTMESGDIRVGLNLIKRSVMIAERDERSTVVKTDIITSFEGSGWTGPGRDLMKWPDPDLAPPETLNLPF